MQSLNLNKEQTKFRVKLPSSQQPLHHYSITFPSWRAVITWPDLDPSGKHQGLPESSYSMPVAKGIRWPKWSLHIGHVHRVIKPQGNVATEAELLCLPNFQGEGATCCICICTQLWKNVSQSLELKEVAFTFIGEPLFIQILLKAWYMSVSLYKQNYILTLPDFICYLLNILLWCFKTTFWVRIICCLYSVSSLVFCFEYKRNTHLVLSIEIVTNLINYTYFHLFIC